MKTRYLFLLVFTVFVLPKNLVRAAGYNGLKVAPGKIITVNYREAELVDVLRAIAYDASINMIINQEVEGKVSLHLEDASVDDVLEVILKGNGYTYIKNGDLVEVVSRGKVTGSNDEKISVELIKTKYLSAEMAYDLLAQLEYKLDGEVYLNKDLSGLLVKAPPSEVDRLATFLASVDQKDLQVIIEARIVEVSQSKERNWGINWGYNADNGQDNRSNASGGSGILDPIPGVDTVVDVANIASGITLGFGLLGNDQFTAIYRNIVADTKTEIVARPTITTLSGKEAMIELVDEIPYQELTFISESGDANSSEIEFKEVGTILNVTPYILEDGVIKMEVKPSISQVTGFTDTGVPFVSSRSVNTNVIVENGQTLAIGGLIKENTNVLENKDPFLAKIPLLGYFFKSSSINRDKTNLIIFVTPKLVPTRELKTRVKLNIREGLGNGLSVPKRTIDTNNKQVEIATENISEDSVETANPLKRAFLE